MFYLVVNYMLLLRKCILACISKHKQNEKENKRPSLCTTLASLTMAAAQTKEKELEKTILCDRQLGISSNFTMIDNQVTTYSLPEKVGIGLWKNTFKVSWHLFSFCYFSIGREFKAFCFKCN